MALFGTNGVRGIVNAELTTDMAMDLAKGFGTFRPGTIAVGRDTRESGEMIKAAVISGLLSTGCRVIDLGIVPTPTIQYYVKRCGLDGGIVITASHNPPEYNGIKGIASDGTEYSHEDEAVVEKLYNSHEFTRAPWSLTGGLSSADPKPMYIDGIIRHVDSEAIKNKKFKVVVDPGCGAACLTAPYMLRRLGCKVITLNAQIDGTFPGRNPEPTGNEINDLKSAVVATGADLGIAHDCDADRVAFVDEKGRFVSEDILLAVMTKHELEKHPGSAVVTPVSSSSIIEEIAGKYGSQVIWTPVGSIYVARSMMANDAVFGGENNGGLIFSEFQYCRDGGMSTAMMLEMMAHSNRSISELAAEMPVYHNIKYKIRCKDAKVIMNKVMDRVRDEKIITIDGIKIYRPEGWVLIRKSGTEPIIRVVADSKTEAGAKKLSEYGIGMVNELNG